ncbi:MAG: hypothetical protein WBE48_07175 [Xanthobacteraceae bacterium]
MREVSSLVRRVIRRVASQTRSKPLSPRKPIPRYIGACVNPRHSWRKCQRSYSIRRATNVTAQLNHLIDILGGQGPSTEADVTARSAAAGTAAALIGALILSHIFIAIPLRRMAEMMRPDGARRPA